MTGPRRQSCITYPPCGHRRLETMPVVACQFFPDCPGCSAVLPPLPGDCCVFCSFGMVPCPPVQAARAAGTPDADCCG